MRTLLGMILGSVLTVGAAFVSDSTAPFTGADQIVNWTVAGEKLHDLATMAHTKIGDLLGS